MSNDDLLKKLSIVYLFVLLAAPISYFIRILYARSLSLDEYGVFYAVIAFLSLIMIFKDMGLMQSLVYFIPQYLIKKDYKKIRSSITFILFIEIFSAAFIMGILYYFRNFLAFNYFKNPIFLTILPFFGLMFLFHNATELFINIFKGYQNEKLYSSVNPVRSAFVLTSSFIATFFFKENILLAFVIIWVLSYLFIIITFFPAFKKLTSKAFKKDVKIESSFFSKLVKYGFFVLLSATAATLLGRIDVLMLTYLKEMSDVGLYEIALPIASIIIVLISPIKIFLFPNISHIHHSHNVEKIQQILQTIYNIGLFVFLPLGLIFFLFPKEIILVMFGAKYIGALSALKILSMGFVLKGFTLLNFSITDGIGKVKTKSLIILFGVILNIIINLFLIPPYGINGAAMSTSISFSFMFLVSLIYLVKKVKFRLNYVNWLKIFVNGAIFVIIIKILKSQIELNLYLESAIVMSISGLIYLIIGVKWEIIDIKKIKDSVFSIMKR